MGMDDAHRYLSLLWWSIDVSLSKRRGQAYTHFIASRVDLLSVLEICTTVYTLIQASQNHIAPLCL